MKKDKLVKTLLSKQLQTRDIVSIIKSNGVDFTLTPEILNALISAGARPAVINAVSENLRLPVSESIAVKPKETSAERPKVIVPDYSELLAQAMSDYKDQKKSQEAVATLESAVKLRPDDPAAYQMLGFVHLYGLNNLTEARDYMRESIKHGGSAVFRVYHDDKDNFAKKCTGSLYISPESILYESDDNLHTFETSTGNIDKVKLDRETAQIWSNQSTFRIFLKIGADKASFGFSPVSGNVSESRMVALLIEESRSKKAPASMFTGSETYKK